MKSKKAERLPVYYSMAQCAGATGIPLMVLKEAKKSGCPAFEFSRVNLGQFLTWFFSNESDSKVDWGERLKRAQALREEVKLEKDKDKTLDKDEVTQAAGEIMAILLAVLDRHSDEMAPILAGLPAAIIKDKLVTANQSLGGELQSKFHSRFKM